MMDDPEDKRGMLMLMSTMLEELGAEFEEENFPKVVTANLGTVDKLLR
jgi:hypothetical protein